MKINAIFELVEDSLYSVKYEGDEFSEFVRIFDNWTNASFIFDFFTNHSHDLYSPVWNGISVTEAVIRTRNEAIAFEEKLLEVAQLGKMVLTDGLSSLFSPLVNGMFEPILEKDKAKANRRSWLRIYAIRIDVNLFLVSGGAIKLTRTMNEREHLKIELQKMDATRKYVKANGEDIYNYCDLKK